MNLITNSDLFDLVKSLSKSEKRFLKLSAAATHLQASVITLFNSIEAENEFTEDFFRSNIKSKNESLEITSQRSEVLYNFILQCLRAFHAESSASFMIKDEITNVLNLFDKAQYKQCRKILNKQKQEAYRFERFHFILELIGLEKLLIIIETQFNVKHNTIENLVKEEQDVISKARNLGEYSLLFSKINLMTRQGVKAKTKSDLQTVQSYLDSPLLESSSLHQSNKALVIFHHCRLILFSRTRDNKAREEECLALLKIMDAAPELIEEMPKRYLTAINNLISIAYEEKKFKTCHTYIKHLKSIANSKAFNTTDLQLKIFTSTYNAELVSYTDSGYFKEAEKIIVDIEKELIHYKGKINKEEVLIFYYNIGIMHTYAGHFEKAYNYISLVLSAGDKLLRQDLQSFARIINIGLLYELNNFTHLGYTLSSLKIYYKTQASLFKTEKLILEYFEKLSQLILSGKEKEKEVFIQFKKDLEEVMKDPNEKNVSLYFDIETYVESKIKGVSMEVLMQKKHEKAWLN